MMTTPIADPEAVKLLNNLVLERILTMGVTGSGKSFQWLKLARALKPAGSIFRVLDTDNDIDYMLRTQFPDLLPENGGNVYVHSAFQWPEYSAGVKWVQQIKLTPEQVQALGPYLGYAYKKPIQRMDWVVVDKINTAWSTVQRYFVSEVFGDDMGEYFLSIRKKIEQGTIAGKGGKPAQNPILEGLDGWKDWSVINRLYEDWILPIIYQVNCNVYSATDVDKLDKKLEKDLEVLDLFGDWGVKPAGQKRIGGQHHTVFLFIPGQDRWVFTTIKDRANRSYFRKTPLTSFYLQYLVAKAGWPMF